MRSYTANLSAFGIALALSLASPEPVRAVPVTVIVSEQSVSPNEIVSIHPEGLNYDGLVYAGVVNMLIDGVLTKGFCIDPFHFSSSDSLTYTKTELQYAPKGLDKNHPKAMGVAAQNKIVNLWSNYFEAATTSQHTAAVLQIAIWEVVGGAYFHLNASSASYQAEVDTMLTTAAAHPGSARLIALTGPGQDYVVLDTSEPVGPTHRVPEGGSTALFLAFATLGLVWLRSRRPAPAQTLPV